MTKALWLALAICVSTLGMAWLALSLGAHWQQVRGSGATARPGVVRVLRVLGFAALAVSLLLCLIADHPTMAALVWAMTLAGSALIVAFTLSWRPRLFAIVVAWVPGRRREI